MPKGNFTNRSSLCPVNARGLCAAAIIALSLAAIPSVADQTPAPSASIVRIDGAHLRGRWLGAGGSTAVRMETDDGEVAVPMDDIDSVTLARAKPREPEGQTLFYLNGGGRLGGDVLEAAKEAILAHTGVADRVSLPFERLAALRLAAPADHPRAAELFDQALADRRPGKDVLITRDADGEEAKTVYGRLESLGPVDGSFVFADRVRAFQCEKVYGIVFAAGAAERKQADVLVNLIGGESFSGKIVESDSSSLRVAASFDSTLDVPLERISNLRFRSDRVTYLSDLKPAVENTQGRLHRPSAVRFDQNVAAGTLSIGGRTFDRGLGVHSRTELTYELDGKYESLAATIGIDDAVRPAGSVAFRVLGDGKLLFDSEAITGADAAKDILVGIKGVKKLTLLVDYGDELDLSDYADWGGARLLRSREAAKDSKSS